MTWILPGPERVESPNRNVGRGGTVVDTLVIHYAVDGDQSVDDPDSNHSFLARVPSDDCMDVARLFRRESRKASAHFVVGRDGSKVQCVALSDTAWHAGGGALPRGGIGPLEPARRGMMNRRSIGIEICNAGWAAPRLRIPGKYRMEAEHPSNPGRILIWETFRPVQYEVLEYLVAQCLGVIPTLRFVTGHEDVVNSHTLGRSGGKVDPGPAFDWGAIPWGDYGITRCRYDFDERAWV